MPQDKDTKHSYTKEISEGVGVAAVGAGIVTLESIPVVTDFNVSDNSVHFSSHPFLQTGNPFVDAFAVTAGWAMMLAGGVAAAIGVSKMNKDNEKSRLESIRMANAIAVTEDNKAAQSAQQEASVSVPDR